jgi:hypothetical protein
MTQGHSTSSPSPNGVPQSLLPINTAFKSLSTSFGTYTQTPGDWYTIAASQTTSLAISTSTTSPNQSLGSGGASTSGEIALNRSLSTGAIIGISVCVSVISGCLCALGILWFKRRHARLTNESIHEKVSMDPEAETINEPMQR